MFDIVVAADLDWGIGKANGLPWPKLRADLAHFKRVTCAVTDGERAAVIMGRKTWESTEVAGRPLPRRLNIVVTRDPAYRVADGVAIASSLDAALALATSTPDVESTFVVGGAALWTEAFGHRALRYIYLTRVALHTESDTHIPDLDRAFVADAWEGAQDVEENGVHYRIERLVQR
ncbi:MAG: dihydrofolate reductase [Kofleriaceae bacterium]